MKTRIIIIVTLIIAAFFAIGCWSKSSQTTRRAEKLYEAYLNKDSVRFDALYVKADQNVIDEFQYYLQCDKEVQEMLNQERQEQEAKHREAKAVWNTIK